MGGFMKYAVEMGTGAMIYVIYVHTKFHEVSAIQKLTGWIHRHI
jgi:hypothetical protein